MGCGGYVLSERYWDVGDMLCLRDSGVCGICSV